MNKPPTIFAYFTNINYISEMDKTKDMYMLYHQLMNIDDIYAQQEYLLNKQLHYDKGRSHPEHPTESNG